MATVNYFMDYVIFFQDSLEYQMAVAIAGGNMLKMSPRDAATLFQIPVPPYPNANYAPNTDLSLMTKGIYFLPPYTPGAEFRFAGSSGIFVNDAILTTTVPGQNANPNLGGPGPDGVFTWSGNIVRSGGAAQAGESAPTAIPQRRWIDGRELFGGPGVSQVDGILRDSSRTIEGHGQSIRGNTSTSLWTKSVTLFRPGLTPRYSWERFYVRFRRIPVTIDTGFWRCHGAPSSGCGIGFLYTTGGIVRAVDIDNIGTQTPAGTVWTPVLNVWYRVDNLIKYGAGAPADAPGIIDTYINGSLVFNFTSGGSGICGASSHGSSDLGRWNAGADAEVEIDLDDWMCADMPANNGSQVLSPPINSLAFVDNNFPIDWLVGSHIRCHYVLSASQVGWTPAGQAVGTMNDFPSPQSRLANSDVVSTTSGATLEGLTDAVTQDVADSLASVIGAVAAIVVMVSKNAGGTDGQLGYRLAGGAPVLTTVDEGVADGTNAVAYLPTGMILPNEIAPFSVVHTKSADANSNTVEMMLAQVEYIGVWSPEDDPLFQYPISRLSNLHNARYANSGWGYLGSQPQAPVYSVSSTYVGNGTYQEITLPAACHFLYIRRVVGGSAPFFFTAASLNAHAGTSETVIPNIRMWFDFASNTFKFSVNGGATSNLNNNGETYQYFAFCDPGMRFCVASEFNHGLTSAQPKANPLIASDFLPIFAIFERDQPVNSGVSGMWFRSFGHTANNGYSVNNNQNDASVANFSAGNVNSFATLHNGMPCSFIAFRTADSGPDGCSGIGNVMIQTATYVGNGTSNKVVPLLPVSGRVPCFVLVFPVNTGTAAVCQRDPSHTSINSTTISGGGNTTFGIIGLGVDQITVADNLLTNGVTFNVIAFCGGLTNVNGTFFSTFCDGDGPYIDPTVDNININVIANGGLVLNGQPAFTLLKDISGIYTLVPGKTNDTLIDRQTGQPSVDTKIPDPLFKTGYYGG